MKKTIADYQKEAYENAKDKGWHNPSKTFGECIALCHAELSEAIECYRDNLDVQKIYCAGYSGEPTGLQEFDPRVHDPEKGCKLEGVGIELADVVIRIFDMCGQFGIDLEKCVELKMKYNKTRPTRHGGKKI